MLSSRSDEKPTSFGFAGTLRTTQGEGQWLTDDVVGFWSVANYQKKQLLLGVGRDCDDDRTGGAV